jgi:phage I-like protein
VANKEYGFISPVFLYNKEGEINCILRAALTNSPNLALPALNAEGGGPETDSMGDEMDKALRAALGIAEAAMLDEALAAIETLKTARNAAGKFTPASRETCLAMRADSGGLEKFKALAAATPAIVDGRAVAPETPPPGGGLALNSEDAAVAKAMGYTAEEYKKMKEARELFGGGVPPRLWRRRFSRSTRLRNYGFFPCRNRRRERRGKRSLPLPRPAFRRDRSRSR